LVKWRFTRKTTQKTQSSLNLNVADCIWEKETRMQHYGIAESSKHADILTDGTVSPWVFFAKSFGCKSSKKFVHPCNESSQVSYKERTKTTMVTKNWTSKVRLSRFPNNPHKAFLLTRGEISQEFFFKIQEKMHAAILKCTVVLFTCAYIMRVKINYYK
jgi:hypothetical protein